MPTLLSKRKMAGGGHACVKIEKRKKMIPGCSLIEAQDVAGVHQDKKETK